jgi:oxygen-independent coproporphyrinogen-3 oxidase
VLLGVRLAEGLPLEVLDRSGRDAVPRLVADGLLEAGAAGESLGHGRAVLTLRGRLLADAVVRALLVS